MSNPKQVALISLILLVSCAVGPDYEPPKIDMPSLNAKEEISEFVTQKWWQMFADSSLNKLEEQALRHNADLKQAVANVDMARAAAGVAIADFFPSVGVFGENGGMFPSQNNRRGLRNLTQREKITNYLGAATASYEIDFFGKYRRANEAARANLLATRAAKESVLLTMTSEVAKTYFLLRALDARLAIARRTLKAREEAYAVYKSRFKNGYCAELDCLRVESEMSSVKTVVLDLESSLAKVETALGVLTGSSPRAMVAPKTSKYQAIEKLRIPSRVPRGIPSDILTRRPDVLQAEGQLVAANAKIGEARAAHFPSISLTGAAGFESESLTNLFANGSDMWNFRGRISLPIFAGGKISAMTAAAKANHRKMLAAYEKSVQVAFKETLDALTSNRKNREIVASRTRQVNALRRSYRIAQKQKDSGLIGLLDLLDVERGLLLAEMELVGALQNQLNAVVDLCKALGGGWNISQWKKSR